jgi:hypothetical protein
VSKIDRLWGRPNIRGFEMSLYFFRISHGRYSGASDQGSEFENREAAWADMTKVCANLLGGISRSMKQKRRMADGNAGRGQKTRVQSPPDGGNAGPEPYRF